MGNIDKFNAVAERYETADKIEVALITAGVIRSYIQDSKNKVALDYGCGTGLIGMQFINDFAALYFVDASYSMTEQVKIKIEKLKIVNAEVLCCDFATHPENLKADYIFVVQVLLHEKNVEPLLGSLYEILNEGGHLIIVDFDKNEKVISNDVHNGFEQKELIKILQKQSFSVIESRTYYHGNNIFMKQDASLFIMDAVK